MKLNTITLENFLTYESLEYDIPRTPLLVQGQNLTEEDQESNGSGKSGIFTAIEFCITGTNSRGVKDKELVMFGQKESRISLVAQCDVRKEFIKIEWLIKVKGSNVLSISVQKDGEWKQVSFSNVNDGKKYIMNWFAIDKDDLFNYYLISKARFKSFFKASNKEKVDLINRFSDASIIDGLDDIDNTELQFEYDTLKSELDKIDGKIELLEEQLEELEEKNDEDLVEERQAEDEVEKIKLLKLSIELEEAQKEREEVLADVESAKVKMEKIHKKVQKAEELLEQIVEVNNSEKQSELRHDSAAVQNKQLKVNSLINQLTIELEGSVECPKCGNEFCVGEHTIEELNDKLEKANDIKGKLGDKLEKINEELEGIKTLDEESRAKRRKALDANNDLFEKYVKAQKKVQKYEKELREIDEDILDIETEQKQIRNYRDTVTKPNMLRSYDGYEPQRKEIRNQITEQRKARLDQESKLNAKGDEIYERNKWKNNFKQFRAHLANQSLEAIEYHMNRYLVEMGSDLKVQMNGYKVLSTGKIKDDISATIIRNGERSYDSFSGGEKGRLLFAAILANRHMLNSTHPYGGLDFLSIDEIFEGVDSLGLKNLVKSAKLLDIAVMIITHVTDENVNDDILLIQKINGTSRIYRN